MKHILVQHTVQQYKACLSLSSGWLRLEQTWFRPDEIMNQQQSWINWFNMWIKTALPVSGMDKQVFKLYSIADSGQTMVRYDSEMIILGCVWNCKLSYNNPSRPSHFIKVCMHTLFNYPAPLIGKDAQSFAAIDIFLSNNKVLFKNYKIRWCSTNRSVP